MNYKGIKSKKEIESLKTKVKGDCYTLNEDCVIDGVKINKMESILWEDNRWINLSNPGNCCKIDKDIEVNCDVGYILSGDIIKEGTTFTEVFENMFKRNVE